MVIAYNEFNNTVSAEEKSAISALAKNLKNVGGFYEKDRDVYEKFLRNLSYLYNNKYRSKSSEKCRFLYQWLYILREKNNILDYPINMVYTAFVDKIVPLGETNICPYYSYDTMYKEPINIIKIKNFYDNILTTNRILTEKSDLQEKDSHYCYAQRYASECAKIYRNMYNTFCSENKHSIPENKNTCSELSAFSTSYTEYLYKMGDIKKKIPDLSGTEKEKHFGYSLDESSPTPGQELIQGSGDSRETLSESGPGHRSVSVGVGEPDNPIPLNATAVVGTMIGIPPFLGLIYRVNIMCT
ncbi:hypothetical protein PVMG_04564 [Plasmodium vivax Mauritania I]|uniref:VIR protein n=1 Tax=Plasmodium vivax Mauritania I TaxID=1035515 RepID=A0A0J9T3Q9_PLAVI|nr:hypothetical protein PVMG_04564 [Plasmodium vivax Mauritania I]